MTYQLECYAILTKGAKILQTLGNDGVLPEDAHLAAAKFTRAAGALAQEPLTVLDIQSARGIVHQAVPSLRRMMATTKDAETVQWITAASEGYNAALDLLDGIEASYKAVPTMPAQASRMSQALRKLIPASWWGSR